MMRISFRKEPTLLDKIRAIFRKWKGVRRLESPRRFPMASRGWMRIVLLAHLFRERMKDVRIRRVLARRIPRILSDLPEIADSLESIMSRVESRFLDLGLKLQSLSADATALADKMRQSAQSIGGEKTGESFLEQLDAVAKGALAELKDCRSGIMENLNTIDTGLGHLGKLVIICSTIEQIGMSLNVVSLNIAVESSRSPEAREMFESFTDEIRKLSGRISRISRDILQDAGASRIQQSAAQDKILKGLFSFNRLNRSAQKVVEDAVADIRDLLKLSMNALERSDRHSREISKHVGEVVIAIQFHDIARQKIEHIAWALREVEGGVGDGATGGDGDDRKSPAAGRARKVIGLQAAQLEEVIDEVHTARDGIDSAFQAIDRLVEDLVADVSISEGKHSREEGRLQVRIGALKTGLEQLRELLDQGRLLEHRIQETAEQVSDTASALSEHIDQVRSISMDLHLKALNAVVKSAKLQEEGRALEVLAQEVSKLSIQATGFVTEVVEILQSLVALSLETELGSRAEDSGKESSIETGIGLIGRCYEQCRNESEIALADSRALRSDIHDTGGRLDFLDELSKDLSGYLDRLQLKKRALEPWTDHETKDADEALEHVAKRYTMASERQLHSRQIGRSTVMAGLPEDRITASEPEAVFLPDLDGEAESSEEDEDMGDNVELF